MLVPSLSVGLPSKGAFLTRLDESYSSDTVPEPCTGETSEENKQQCRKLQEERTKLQQQIKQTLEKLSQSRPKPRAKTGFVPLAPIFPLKRDSFTEGKSAEKQLTIYRKEWQRVQKRFQCTSDTNYAYKLEHEVQRKTAEIKELESIRTILVATNRLLEREITKAKSDQALDAEVANMSAVEAHVALLRGQVSAMEQIETQNRELFQTSSKALEKTEKRYEKIKSTASAMGISLREQKTNPLKEEFDALQKRLLSLEKVSCYKEQVKIRELAREKKRLQELEDQMQVLFADQEINLGRVRTELSLMHRGSASTQKYSLLASLSASKLQNDAPIAYTNRLAETMTGQFLDKPRCDSPEQAGDEGESSVLGAI